MPLRYFLLAVEVRGVFFVSGPVKLVVVVAAETAIVGEGIGRGVGGGQGEGEGTWRGRGMWVGREIVGLTRHRTSATATKSASTMSS